jgi:hypothetical protein
MFDWHATFVGRPAGGRQRGHQDRDQQGDDPDHHE